MLCLLVVFGGVRFITYAIRGNTANAKRMIYIIRRYIHSLPGDVTCPVPQPVVCCNACISLLMGNRWGGFTPCRSCSPFIFVHDDCQWKPFCDTFLSAPNATMQPMWKWNSIQSNSIVYSDSNGYQNNTIYMHTWPKNEKYKYKG